MNASGLRHWTPSRLKFGCLKRKERDSTFARRQKGTKRVQERLGRGVGEARSRRERDRELSRYRQTFGRLREQTASRARPVTTPSHLSPYQGSLSSPQHPVPGNKHPMQLNYLKHDRLQVPILIWRCKFTKAHAQSQAKAFTALYMSEVMRGLLGDCSWK